MIGGILSKGLHSQEISKIIQSWIRSPETATMKTFSKFYAMAHLHPTVPFMIAIFKNSGKSEALRFWKKDFKKTLE